MEQEVIHGTKLQKRANGQRLNDLGTNCFIKTMMMTMMIMVPGTLKLLTTVLPLPLSDAFRPFHRLWGIQSVMLPLP